MKTKQLLSDWIYEFEAPPKVLKQSLAIVQSSEWIDNTYNSACRTIEGKSDLLLDWLNACLEEARVDLELTCEKLSIASIWANKSRLGEWHHSHVHGNSYCSGILYLTESGAQTWLSRRSMWVPDMKYPLLDIFDYKRFDIIEKIPTVPGKLILFPSSLVHSVNEHDRKDARYTVSFNAFPAGDLKSGDYASRLHIKIK
jgi:hypothetical protein